MQQEKIKKESHSPQSRKDIKASSFHGTVDIAFFDVSIDQYAFILLGPLSTLYPRT
ncbi:hypothetical protein T4B_15349 [Trichinella pseudospiralis]|uniref:Uncharacterized protein n=1 Tax=Trichinella pseudospiralis TaxID=6337 RepID=A0A0V1IBL4_TRIPS|nr:hypothetical protein T4B_15349 [Trichinella pseudospiralis]